MAPITSLPLEIFYCIAETTDFDVFSLRLTCKALNTKLRDIHLDSLYRSQNIFMTPMFFETLLKVSENSFAPHLRARELVFNFQVPYVSKVEGLHDYRMHDGLDDEDLNAFVEMERLAYDHAAGVRGIIDGRYKLSVASVLLAFPRVESIAFRYAVSEPFSPFEFNLLYPSLGFKPGNCPSMALREYARNWMLEEPGIEVDTIWWQVLNALKATIPAKTQTITMAERLGKPTIKISRFNPNHENNIYMLAPVLHPEWFVSIDWFTDPLFPNLRRLDLDIDLREPVPDHGYDNGKTFGQWLVRIGGRLEYFSLSTPYVPRADSHKLLLLPTAVGLPNLKALDISSMSLDMDNLKTFLYHSRNTLEVLSVSNCWSNKVGNESYFRILKFASETLCGLRLFVFDIESDSPAISMKVEGLWASAATCEGIGTRLVDTAVFQKFVLNNLKELLDANSNADRFWETLMYDDPPIEALEFASQYYSEGRSSDFDSDGCASDQDYLTGPDPDSSDSGSDSGFGDN